MITTIYLEDGTEKKLPTKWCICGQCRGEGKSSAYLGAYTMDEMDQQGQDFIDDYFSGNYDRICETCKGAGKVQEVDFEVMSPSDRKLWEEQVWEIRQERAAHLAEIRAGA